MDPSLTDVLATKTKIFDLKSGSLARAIAMMFDDPQTKDVKRFLLLKREQRENERDDLAMISR